jgi:DNA-binding MarR family transcriptional regulator
MGRVSAPSRDELRQAAELRLAIRRFHAATEDVLRQCGLTYRQYLLLLVIESAPRTHPLSMGDLSSTLKLAPSSITELLDRGEQAGVLERTGATHDSRISHVRATVEGRRRFVKAFRALADEREALAGTAARLLDGAEAREG